MVKNDKPKTAVGSKAPVEPKEKSPYVKKGMHLVQAKRIRIDVYPTRIADYQLTS